MTKVQIDRWFSLSDRVDQLISRRKISLSDSSSLLKPIRQIEDHNADVELAIAEREIARTEKAGFLLGSEAALAEHQSKERSDAFFASRPR